MLQRIFISKVISFLSGIGSFSGFSLQSIFKIFSRNLSLKLLVQQMEFIGNKSIVIISLASIMVGAVFGIQFGEIFKIFKAESMIGAAASFALSKELAPVVGAFLVTGRAGSSMAAEIATMKVNEQIDAMKVMAVDPISYLIAPRVLATVLMLPLLSAIFVLFGVISAFFIGVTLFDVDVGVFIDKIRWITKPSDLIDGMIKAMIFGAILSCIGCYKGYHTERGAKGVGRATTEAVVYSLVTILVSDFFISYAQLN